VKSGGKKRPPTRSNPISGPKSRESSTNAFERPASSKRKGHIPEDLADAAEAALDDLVSRASPVPGALTGRKTPVPPPLMPPDDDDELDEPPTTSRAESSVMALLGQEDDDEVDLASTGSGRRYQGSSTRAIGKSRASQVQPPGMTEQVPTIALADLPGERSEPTSDERPSARMRDQPAPAFEEVTNRASPLPPALAGRPNVDARQSASSPTGRASPLPANLVPRPPATTPTGPTGRASPLPANVVPRSPASTPTGPTGRASPVPASMVPGRADTGTPTAPTARQGTATPTMPTAPTARQGTATPTMPTSPATARPNFEAPTRPAMTAPPRTHLETPTVPSSTPLRASLATPTVPTSTPLARIALEKSKAATSRASVATPTRPSASPPDHSNVETPSSWDVDTDDAESVGAALAYDGALRRASEQVAIERVLAELPPLRFAVYEDSAHLASAQGAIVAAGHVVALGASGRDGMTRVLGAVRSSTHAIDAVVVALPSGEAIIDAALALESRRPIIIAAVTGKSVDAVQKAIAAGADLVTARPHDVERFAPLLLAAGRIEAERRSVDRLRAKLDELSDAEPRGLQTLDIFERNIDKEIKRAKKFDYPLSVLMFAVEIPAPAPPPFILGILRARAGNVLINSIRDIDCATRLDDERFLVLSPYTDRTAAVSLARRIIASVAKGDPVVSSGRTFVPRFVGGVAGPRSREPLTYTKLVKDATHALETARRDGIELA
jgi:hypothetical protein